MPCVYAPMSLSHAFPRVGPTVRNTYGTADATKAGCSTLLPWLHPCIHRWTHQYVRARQRARALGTLRALLLTSALARPSESAPSVQPIITSGPSSTIAAT
jgi:hypothetical protein